VEEIQPREIVDPLAGLVFADPRRRRGRPGIARVVPEIQFVPEGVLREAVDLFGFVVGDEVDVPHVVVVVIVIRLRIRRGVVVRVRVNDLAEEIADDPRPVGRRLEGAPGGLTRLDLAVLVRVDALVHAQELQPVVLVALVRNQFRGSHRIVFLPTL
jgi:hypothetical protein